MELRSGLTVPRSPVWTRAYAVRQDAYLYVVTPDRSTGEIDRIARTPERAGYLERARRVLQPLRNCGCGPMRASRNR